MDIFVINIKNAEKVSEETLLRFQKKEITDDEKLKTHCLSYLLLDKILREVYGIEDTQIVFDNNKPLLLSGEKYFSISHSGDFIALAFSDSNCGIDIEKTTLREFTKISERMGFEATTLGEFYQEWTQYEAIYKLGEDSVCGSYANYELEGYAMTAVSVDELEDYEVFCQEDDE